MLDAGRAIQGCDAGHERFTCKARALYPAILQAGMMILITSLSLSHTKNFYFEMQNKLYIQPNGDDDHISRVFTFTKKPLNPAILQAEMMKIFTITHKPLSLSDAKQALYPLLCKQGC